MPVLHDVSKVLRYFLKCYAAQLCTHTSSTHMKNHTQTHPSRDNIGAFEPVHPERFAAAQKSTWVSIGINVLLTSFQVVGGFFAHSQALMADGLHSLSDLFSDVLVLFANRHGNRHADADHPYGHARIETAATLILGTFLAVLGVVLLVAAAMRLQHPEALRAVSPLALAIGVLALIAKEGMFRYMLAVAKRVRSQMLVANAWHARSDAASSLVVIVGVAGNLLGYTFFDLLAAAVVGVMIAHMGGKLALEALAELIDTGLTRRRSRRYGKPCSIPTECAACMSCAPARWPTTRWSMRTLWSIPRSVFRKGITSPNWRVMRCSKIIM